MSPLPGNAATPEKENEFDSPLFVFGAARSGTTLTYSLLLSSGCFPRYEAESRILECASRYGSLRSRRNRERFLRDYLLSRQFARSGLSAQFVIELAAQRSASYVDFLDGFMAEICRSQGKRRWVEKSPNNVNFVSELAEYYPRARFLHVVRDGRAVVVSQQKHGFGERYTGDPRRQLIWIANVWDMQVEAGRRAMALGNKYLEIRYEDLVTDVSGALKKIGSFADVELDAASIEKSDVGALGGPNTAFEMERGGISTAALDRWRSILKPDEIELLQWQIGGRLRELGYSLVDTGERAPSLKDRVTARLSRSALEWKHRLNVYTPLGRVARKPLEIGLS